MKLTVPFRKELQRLIAVLNKQHGFTVVDEAVALNGGGDGFITVQSPDLRLRFVRDEAHLFADVAAHDSGPWYDLTTTLEYLNGVRQLAGSFDVIGLQVALAANFGALCNLFSSNGFAAPANSLERFTALSGAERWAALRDACVE